MHDTRSRVKVQQSNSLIQGGVTHGEAVSEPNKPGPDKVQKVMEGRLTWNLRELTKIHKETKKQKPGNSSKA